MITSFSQSHCPSGQGPRLAASGFQVLYADPPWRLSGSGKGSPPYPMMVTKDISALPVERPAAPDCALLLWAVHSHLPDALAVIRAWGFSYKTVAFTWVKRTPRDTGFFLGRGYWTHANAEVCLLATRGKPRRAGTGVSSLVVSPRREHSQKPDEVRERIVRICGYSGTCLGRSCPPARGCPAGAPGATRSSATSAYNLFSL